MLGPKPHGATAKGPLLVSMSTQLGSVKAAQKVQGPRELCIPVPTPSARGLLGGCNPPTDFEASRAVMGAVDYVVQLQPAPPLVMTSHVAVPISG
jgi:hypothetical protein